jgi:hypothetical protein
VNPPYFASHPTTLATIKSPHPLISGGILYI